MRRIATALFTASLLLTSCTNISKGDVAVDDITRIEQSLVRGSALAWELTQAQSHLSSMCMQDLGFFIHHPNLLHGGAVPDRFEGFASPYSRIPTYTQAVKFGFGVWIYNSNSEEAEAMFTDQDYQAFAADDLGWQDPNEEAAYAEWKSTDENYQQAWLEAFMGPERLEFNQSFESGAIISGESTVWPPFDGCELTVNEIIYGESIDNEIAIRSFWADPELESPLTWVADGELYDEFSAQYADEEEDFLTCIEEHDHGEWKFDDVGFLPTSSYLNQLYQNSLPQNTAMKEVPNLTNEAQDEADLKAYEFAMALDFAQCADTSGLREGTEEAWSRMYVERLIPWETEIYAWEQVFETYLTNAQNYIGR